MPIYMKFEGVDGAVTGKYAKYIELESASLTRPNNVSSPGCRCFAEGSVGQNARSEALRRFSWLPESQERTRFFQ